MDFFDFLYLAYLGGLGFFVGKMYGKIAIMYTRQMDQNMMLRKLTDDVKHISMVVERTANGTSSVLPSHTDEALEKLICEVCSLSCAIKELKAPQKKTRDK
jgi:hypothetical protein